MKPVTIEQILQAAGGVLLAGKASAVIENVTIDSREEAKDALFVPIIGERTDGHKYAAGAAEHGAVALFMQKESIYKEEILALAEARGLAVLSVEDTVAALQQLAAWYRSRFSIPVIGITGSVGKTTTKEMIAAALETEKTVLKTVGNRNSQIGLSLMMLCMEEKYDIAVIEMGMSEEGEMEKLSYVARPECAVLTNIGVSHIAQFGSRENIRKEKLCIVNRFITGASLFINGNDTLLHETATQITQKKITIDCSKETYAALNRLKAVTYGIGSGFDYCAEQIETTAEGTSFVAVCKKDRENRIPVTLKVFGEHNVMNALAAIAVAEAYGIAPERAAEGLKEYRPIAMRGQIKENKGITWIDDTYNASPDSMKSGIQVLLSLKGRRRIAVLADALELGEAAESLHREVGAYAAECERDGNRVDVLVAIGENAAHLADEAKKRGTLCVHTAASNAEAAEYLKTELKAGDVVLVKGSRGMKTDEIVKAFLGE